MADSPQLRLVDDRLALNAPQVHPGRAWQDFAACKGQTHLFFAKKAERPEARQRREAKAKRLCDVCPVLEPCRETARTNREYGYWGGESEEDRYFAGYPVTAAVGVRARLAATSEAS